MRRPWQIWLSYALCVALLALATFWLSAQALETDQAEHAARRDAQLEENVRLALWRMDSALVPLIAQVSSTSPESFLPSQNAAEGREFLADRRIRRYFHVPESAHPSAQQQQGAAPFGNDLGQAPDDPMLRPLLAHIEAGKLNGLLPAVPPATAPKAERAPQEPVLAMRDENVPNAPAAPQVAKGQTEFEARQQMITSNVKGLPAQLPPPRALDGAWRTSPIVPLWLDGQLVLARRAQEGELGKPQVQGVVLDWDALQRELLAETSRLLPGASLLPAEVNDAAWGGRLLAALPLRLEPGELEMPSASGWSPLLWALAFSWFALAAAALAVAMVLQGVVALSERRSAFVSAVTHELRTPLTTFRMYAEMLSTGMVQDDGQRQAYLETLRVEADRLTHLVANVLAYARLEKGGLAQRIESISLADLLRSAAKRSHERAAAAGAKLAVSLDRALATTHVRADPAAVEQILFNLVDNACKYGLTATDSRIELTSSANAGRVVLRVIDHGPGIPAAARRRLFQPFHKSAQDAAVSAPGVGLGLALCRRLARQMGGDLLCEPRESGACFALVLKLAER